jgi:catechol 2,3-dioxygenase-like lactoylglutathione lyase family enzyme
MENRSPDNGVPVTQVRIARPTDRLAELVRFYRDALGLKQIASFEGHAGYDGVMLALPGRRDHLEFTLRHFRAASPLLVSGYLHLLCAPWPLV